MGEYKKEYTRIRKTKNRGRNSACYVLYYWMENFGKLERIHMVSEIQKASLWKRIAAGILDMILLMILAVGVAWGLSAILNYDSFNAEYQQINEEYAAKYGVDLSMTQEKIAALPEAEQTPYRQFDEAINDNDRAVYLFNLLINLILLIVTGGILAAFLLLELLVPILMGNGQTVGKKVFSLCLVRNDGVKLNGVQLFARTVLGKFAVETMILVYTAIMIRFQVANKVSVIMAAAVLIVSCVSIIVTRHNCLLHDLMVGTVVVDYGSQRIFKSTDDLIAYQKKIAAERAARQTY